MRMNHAGVSKEGGWWRGRSECMALAACAGAIATKVRSLPGTIDLTTGVPCVAVPSAAIEAAAKAMRDGKNSYTPPAGLPGLRDAICAKAADEYGRKDLATTITSGVTAGVDVVLRALLRRGDEVLIPEPYFPMHPVLTDLAGGVPIFVPSHSGEAFNAPVADSLVSKKTKAILLSSPNNPSGMYCDAMDIARFAERHGLWIIQDQSYRGLTYNAEAEADSSVAPLYDKTITLWGFSKPYAAAGWRIGAIVAQTEITKAIEELLLYTHMCAPAPLQHGILTALGTPMEPVRRVYEQKRNRVTGRLSGAFDFSPPQGGMFLWLRSPEGLSGTEFAQLALHHGVGLFPGSVFSHADTHARLSFSASDEDLDKACDTLRGLVLRGGSDLTFALAGR